MTTPTPAPVRRSTPRRLVLAGLLLIAMAGIVIAVFVLDALVGSLHRGTAIAQSTTGAELPDCQVQYPDWIATWVDESLTDIRLEYGDDEDAVVIPWTTPGGFPAAAFAWADAVPDCGSMMLVESTGDVWTTRLDISSIDKAQFTAISTSLSALGFLLTADQVPHEALTIAGAQESTEGETEGEDQSGDSAGASWYREFSGANGTLALTFYPDDALAPNPVGELVISYYQPIE